MKKWMNGVSAGFMSLTMALGAGINVKAQTMDFADVDSSHWAYDYVNEMRSLAITNGIGDNLFGVGQTVTRAEFVTFLCTLMKWDKAAPSGGSFADTTADAWYYPYVETALAKGAIANDGKGFRPTEPITREEMAVMIVRTLGQDNLAKQITYLGSPFADVSTNIGYITMAKDLGIISGMGDNQFMPKQTATREQAAVMVIKMKRLLTHTLDEKNAFYAIKSANQMNKIDEMTQISFGWSRLEWDENGVWLNTTAKNNNEYNIPSGYEEPYEKAAAGQRLLMIAVKDADAVKIVGDANLRNAAAKMIADAAVNGVSGLVFDGVVLDFETLRGNDAKQNYNELLGAVRKQIGEKLMVVAVHPQRRDGLAYYDGYDYKTIGNLADRVILMAHDYNAKKMTDEEMAIGSVITPLAPIDEVYYALRAITDSRTGVQDKNKILLQMNFASAQWKLKDGKVINSTPYNPAYDAINARIKGGAEMKYSAAYESPYITFHNSDDGTDNVVWYENAQSINAKWKLAELFGIKGVSYWRIGIFPE